MSFSISSIYFWLIQSWVIVFWILPEPVQKFFRILLLVFSFYLFFLLSIHGKIKKRTYFFISLITILFIIICLHGGFQTSLVNTYLSSFAVGCYPFIYRSFTNKELHIARKISYICCLSLFLQLCICRSADGRPSLLYEINWSGAYLFLFFLYCDRIKFTFGKIFVSIASLLILSRLLIYSIVFFYIVRYGKPIIARYNIKWGVVFPCVLVLFYIFNFYFLLNVDIEGAYDTSISRITTVNDGSNKLRFSINVNLLNGLFVENDTNLRFGYGQISRGSNPEYTNAYFLMPHNEFLDSIAEIGYIATICLIIFIFPVFSKYFTYRTYEYYLPILLYTLLLWCRFLIILSPEMFFIIFLIINKANEKKIVTCN